LKLTSHFALRQTNFYLTQTFAAMPKEKTTTRAAKKGGKADGGRKKKGTLPSMPALPSLWY